MRKITLFFFACIPFFLFSQNLTNNKKEFRASDNSIRIAVPGNNTSTPVFKNTQEVKGVTFLFEDFEDGAATFPPDGWTTQSHAQSTGIEEWHFSDHFFDSNPNTEANARNIASIRYVTSTNQLDEWLITPEVTLPSSGSFDIEFDWLSSYYWHIDPFNNGDITVLVSTDGGSTWSAPLWQEDNQTLIEASGVVYPWETYEWYHSRVDLSAYAGNNIKVAFRFYGLDAAFFDLDDVRISERNANDVSVLSPIAHFFYTNGGAYSQMPIDQVMGGMYGADIKNIGTESQNNITLNVDVTHDGESVYNQTATATLTSLAFGENDTLLMEGEFAFVAEEIGFYEATITVVQDETDEDADNNSAYACMTVTPNTFARHYNVESVTGPLNYTDGENGDFFGSTFHVINEDTVYGIRVFINENSEAGGTLIAKLFDDAENELLSSEEYDITEADLGKWVVLPFTDYTGEDLIIAGDMDYTAGVEIYCLPDTVYIGADNSTPYQYLRISTSIRLAGEWFYTDIQPGIELLTMGWEPSGFTDSKIDGPAVYPNPAYEKVTFNGVSGATINIYSVDGSLVHSLNSTQEQAQITLTDWSDGIYLVKINKDGQLTSHKLIVSH
ncbi:MAG: hypothetical protein A2W91_00365 [Bacteroidetes bacterium GWF2_38_335]|nr:MAG: hypothetical protein A2W91_00365 [Bacteroidetes bacterium GWF2_38_335]OFY78286.1 MAG: hypothetical protein A2281_03745 [Bacteroidetes bacterium RIFOXYA12_FULL_38_20]HBS87519.1 hypothetical protein [Bacteroidales bacterium]